MDKLILIVISVLLVSCNPQESSPHCDQIGGSYIAGEIGVDADKCNIDYGKTIDLNSGGGSLAVAIRIADRIALNETGVFVSEYCGSACTVFLASADHRSMCHYSFIGVHQGGNDETTEKYLEYMKQDPRIDYEAIAETVADTGFLNVALFNSYKAKKLGLIDQVIECD